MQNYFGTDKQMKMLTVPGYFAKTKQGEHTWEHRRRILLDMCGDVTEADVINSSLGLGDLPKYLAVPGAKGKHYSVDEYKKIAKHRMAEINKILKEDIPNRIDEANMAMRGITGLSLSKIEADIAQVNADISKKEREKQGMRSGDAAYDALRKQRAKLETRLAEARAAHASEASKLNEAAFAEIMRLKNEQLHMRGSAHAKKAELADKQRSVESLKATRQSLFDNYNKVSAEQWQGDETCPTCQRPLPEDEVALAKEAFNLSKARRLEEINKSGKATCSKEMIAALEAEIEALTADMQATESSVAGYDAMIHEAERKIKAPAPFETTDAHAQITQQISSLHDDETKAGSALSLRTLDIENALKVLRMRLDRLHEDKSKIGFARQQKGRMAELEAMEKGLAKEHESLERGVYLCDEFIKAKVAMLTDNINRKFDTLSFRLFEGQVNGGLKEDCEAMIPSVDENGEMRMVPYTEANLASQVNAGLEIIDVLSKHFGKSLPVFVDQAESVTELRSIGPQLIRLVVSKEDAKLRLVTEEQQGTEAETANLSTHVNSPVKEAA